MNSRSFRPFLLLALAALLFAGLPALDGLLVDWWWFRELGFDVVFTKELATRAALFGGTLLAVSLLLLGNLRFAQRGIVPDPPTVRMANGAEVDLARTVGRLARPAALVVAFIAALGASGGWETVQLALHAEPFGSTDPVFGRDIGFYVFTLPLLATVLGTLSFLLVLTLVLLVPVYLLRGDLVVQGGRLRVEPSAGGHLGALLALLFVIFAVQLWFVDSASLLYGTDGPLVGAGYTDLAVRLPALRLGAGTALLAAVLVVLGAVRGRVAWFAALGIGLHVGAAVLGRGIVPALVQQFLVAPTELTRETPYLAAHIEATRRAWGIDAVETRELGTEGTITAETLREHDATIANVRLWDRDPLLRTFGQLQEIRTYYDFVSVDDDRYWIDSTYRQVLLAPRELNAASLPTRTFINEHLTFTHGMGLTLGPVNEVTAEGLPVLFVKDLPPASSVSLRVTRPQIYYGELTDQFVFTGTKQREFDYPAGDENVYTTYDGLGGVPLDGLVKRLVFAAYFGSSKILLSGDITSESRILYRRDIVERVRSALPFLTLDADPYIVVADDGTLKWIVDGYTTTGRYPYAWRTRRGVSYMRNSVKVVVDAYDGTVVPYVAEPGDPIVRAWDRILPGVLQPLEAMPADLRAHVRYPGDLFRVQTELYTAYHLDTPEKFYNREDQWQIPAVQSGGDATPFMRHIIMRLPGEAEAEYIFMTPFTPRGKDNLAAWMVARNDGEHYGKLRVYRLPRQSLVYGPRQIENRINQDTEIARQITLWDQRGSQVIRGELLVIPIEEALLYVQPIYLQADGGRIPELKRVIVAYGNRVVMRETLDGALAALFGEEARPPVDAAETETVPVRGDDVRSLQELAEDASRILEEAQAAQRAGDWAGYGEALRRLEAVLARMRGGEVPPA